MAKIKTAFFCQKCGSVAPKWIGKCPDCGEWNSFVEETIVKRKEEGLFFTLTNDSPTLISEISLDKKSRFEVGIKELDRVLGGGLVPGSLVLLGGDPGIGKSTLILQALNQLALNGIKVLYATGEESKEQIKLRAERLDIHSDILILAENSAEKIIEQVQKLKPQVLVVDSIQTVYLSNIESAPGSVSQVREVAGKLLFLSKTTGISTLIIGHVTKEGALAGPRILEHLVDCVLYFEGDSSQHYRILRTTKNRFGSTNEIGVFEMAGVGLKEVLNPSSLFLPENELQKPGSAVTASLEGVRPLLVEIQALVSSSVLVNPRRTTLGVDSGRVALLVAVLEKILGLNLYNQDVYVNAAGGFKVTEPSSDLAILAALVSSFQNKPLVAHTLILGEVGLTGEIRAVFGADLRMQEAAKLGFKRAILPKNNNKIKVPAGLEVYYTNHVEQALDLFY